MTEHAAMLALPRTRETILRELEAHRRDRELFFELAGEFAALNTDPIIVVEGVVQPRELKIPPALRVAMERTIIAILALEIELHGAS